MSDKKPVHVGEAAARVLERLKRSAGRLVVIEDQQYDCTDCKDTGVIPGKGGATICKHVKCAIETQGKERFF